MTKLYCADITCKYHKNTDLCTAKKVLLNYRNMATVNEGRVDMLVCQQYEENEFYKRVKEELNKAE